MTLSTHLGLNQEVIPPGPAVYYTKPSHLYTKKDAALLNSRVIGDKVAQLHVLTKFPTHYCRLGTPLSPEAIFELGLALRSGRKLTVEECLSLHAASQAGQIVCVNLYSKVQSFDETPPTQKEAAYYLQRHFEDGTLRSWITEYWHRGENKKGVWTVGDSIHADDRRYIDFNLWKYHFKAKPRDIYKPQGIRHSDDCRITRWIALDVDNHGNEEITLSEWLGRYMALHRLLLVEGMPYLAQVNPKNGSYQLWSPVLKWGLGRVAEFADRVTSACPWVREIYPTKSKWHIICPLRPDKVNLIGAGELSQVDCRPQTWCYDLVAAWRWHRKPTMINPDPVCIVLARSFLNGKTASPTAKKALSPAFPVDSAATAASRQETKPAKTGSSRKVAKGRFGPLRGRWLELLSDTYLDGVEPPVMSVVSFLPPQLRLFRDGETEIARKFLRDVIDFMRSRCWTFSDRLQNDPDELVRTLDPICKDRKHKAIDKEMKKLDATRKRLDDLGFDGSFPSLLKALEARRNAGRFSGAVDLPVVENESITTSACAMMILTKMDHQGALMLVKRILNHIAHQSELAYSVLKEIAHTMGVRLSNYKAYKVFSILFRHGLIVKVKNYSRCAAWSIGNQYSVTEKVQFVVDEPSKEVTQGQDKAAGHDTRTQEDICNNTISRFQTTGVHSEPLDLTEIALEAGRLRANKRFIERIRKSRAGGS